MAIRDLIRDAFREGNLIPIAQTPTNPELTEALARLQRLVDGYFGFELGEGLRDWTIPPPQRTAPVAAYYPHAPTRHDLTTAQFPYPPSNVRLVVAISETITVYFQNNPEDGARMALIDAGSTAALTLDGNGRLIEGDLMVELDAPMPAREWFYRADLAGWVLRTPLTLDGNSPFPPEFDDLLVCDLAVRLSPTYGAEARSSTVDMRARMLDKLEARYRQHPPVLGGAAAVPNALQSFRCDLDLLC